MKVKGFEIKFSEAVIPYTDDGGDKHRITAREITKRIAYQITDYGDYDDLEAAVDLLIAEKFTFGETIIKMPTLPYGLIISPVGSILVFKGFLV